MAWVGAWLWLWLVGAVTDPDCCVAQENAALRHRNKQLLRQLDENSLVLENKRLQVCGGAGVALAPTLCGGVCYCLTLVAPADLRRVS